MTAFPDLNQRGLPGTGGGEVRDINPAMGHPTSPALSPHSSQFPQSPVSAAAATSTRSGPSPGSASSPVANLPPLSQLSSPGRGTFFGAQLQPPAREYSDGRHLGLTERQRGVLRLMLLGLSNKAICKQLDLAEGTVKVHVSAVLRALGVATRAQVVVAAMRSGIRVEEMH
jgi:DNA-binding CsgD family transcriptional regulator